MKKVFILSLLVISCINLTAQDLKTSHNPQGKWNFEAPTAPQGFTSGVVEVTSVSNKLAATMSFTGNDNKFPCDTVKFVNDTLRLNVYIEGSDVIIKIKFDEADKMSGAATAPDGEIPLVLTREKSK